jgi:hypothetical protein
MQTGIVLNFSSYTTKANMPIIPGKIILPGSWSRISLEL